MLTTHYLEEAEALCGRIAMLKQGRVVALDSTAQPAARASPALRARAAPGAATTLPDGADARACCATRTAASSLRLRDYDDVERCCAALRDAGAAIEELELGSRRTWRTCSCSVHAATATAWAASRTLLYKELLRFWKVSFQTVAAPVLTALLYLLIFAYVLERPRARLRRR